MRSVVLFGVLAVLALGQLDSDLVMTQEMVDRINSANSTWKASLDQGRFFGNAMTIRDAKVLMGARASPTKLPEVVHSVNADLPDNFDSSKNWPDCKTILTIRDQSACGSCWALGAAEAMSDRYCTVLGKQDDKYKSVAISAGDLMACCSSCGGGCGGGFPEAAWEYWSSHGLPSVSCDPYPFPKCEHHIPAGHYPACPSNEYSTPKCNKTCTDGSTASMMKGKSAYSVSGEQKMMQEIYQNGPIEVAFSVYSDFLTYKSGVYKHTSGSMLGGHAVKAIGWGVTSAGDKYWIINNSWNNDWGNNGQFWIARGNDECGIESQGAAGLPATF